MKRRGGREREEGERERKEDVSPFLFFFCCSRSAGERKRKEKKSKHEILFLLSLILEINNSTQNLPYPPPVVRHQDRRVRDVAHQVVERPVVRERLVAAVVSDHEQRPEHRALRDPVERPRPPAVDGQGRRGQADDDGDVPGEVGHRLDGVLLEALGRDRGLDVREREGRRRGEGDLGLRLFGWVEVEVFLWGKGRRE